MTWIADLSSFGPGDNLRAIGWLERGKPFTTGEVSEEFFEKLCQLLLRAWDHVASGGKHCCDLCQFSFGGTARWRDYTIWSESASSLYIPACGYLYVAPTNIAHYIDAHNYRPPDEFCLAVLSCPPMRSVTYFQELLANGGRELVRGEIG